MRLLAPVLTERLGTEHTTVEFALHLSQDTTWLLGQATREGEMAEPDGTCL